MAELVVPAILVAIAVFLIIGTATMVEPPSVQRPGPAFFPGIIIGLLLIMAVLHTVQTLRTVRARRAGLLQDEQEAHLDADGDPIEEIPPDPPRGREPWPAGAVTDWRAVLTVLGSLVAFMVLLRPVGWIVAAAVLFWGVAYALGSRRPIFDVSVALVMSSVIQLTFGYLLGLNLPAGFLAGVM
ncbi:tripartite tricarboxylate transporter TctB family protein [Pseudonocardia charpentierae]|uniref:Tripartite tricarboxylate transporter TctB family protein n=1 Tax=Pseudonocardia charpentierae TaxID=3075545 RepID=A0ABU2NHA9_9PSEU|nr:tripartite tricarboxylate transporter TctB family protein [Pseudonocardia sp. DSM 45834]MDT0353330.1 tripartite tricarboxylate transporter TctB family protein [Pseudonocardia sp. DSM 45834]